MEIRAFPADAVVIASGGCGLIYGRSTMSMVCTGSAASRAFQAGAKYGNAEFIQVHPTAIPGADKLRLMSESARGEGGRVWVPRKPQDPAPAERRFPRASAYYFLEERYPKYGNLVPRDIATREIFNVCTYEGLERREGSAVRLSRPDAHSAARRSTQARRHSGNLREIPGRRSARSADEDLPGRPLLDGRAVGRLRAERPTAACVVGSPRNQQTNIPGLYAIGECDYQYHGANRLGANSLLSCIFSGLIVAPGIATLLKVAQGRAAAEQPASLFEAARKQHQAAHDAAAQAARRRRESVPDSSGAGRRDDQGRHGRAAQRSAARSATTRCSELAERAERCSLSDTGNWTNQNVVFTKSLRDMFPLAKAILQGRAAARRMPRGPLQARVRHARARGDRPGRAPPRGREVVRSRSRTTRPSGSRSTIATLDPTASRC